MSTKTVLPFKKPLVDRPQLALLEKLCNAVAVSGDEGEVRQIVIEQVKPLADELKVDALGNVLVTHKAKSKNALRVMIAAHMDEVGFMLVESEEGGLFRFELVGGIDERMLPAKPVWVGKEHVPGVIGAKPIHLTEKGEIEHTIPLETMRIDVGPDKGKLKVGDRATFATTFQRIGPSLRAKALDDRIGVASLIELVRNAPENIELLAAFTVQEEVGLRGARVAGYAFDPDLAFVIDNTPAYDLPSWDGEENTQYNARLGAGPAIYIADSVTLSDPRLVRHLITVADKYGIPYQFRQPGGGGTDAGAIHKQRAGIPSVSISIPGRYAHTPALISRISDWENTLELMLAALHDLLPDILKAGRE
jgi:tetrahedral aminopeptidase